MSEQPPEERAYHHHAHLLNRKHSLEQTILEETLALRYWTSQIGESREIQQQRDIGIKKARLNIRQAKESLKVVKVELKSVEPQKPKKAIRSLLRPPDLSSTKQPQITTARMTRELRRKAAIEPILESLGISANQWATKAGVDPSVVYDYLHGKSNPRPVSRKSLAEAIKLKSEELPQ